MRLVGVAHTVVPRLEHERERAGEQCPNQRATESVTAWPRAERSSGKPRGLEHLHVDVLPVLLLARRRLGAQLLDEPKRRGVRNSLGTLRIGVVHFYADSKLDWRGDGAYFPRHVGCRRASPRRKLGGEGVTAQADRVVVQESLDCFTGEEVDDARGDRELCRSSICPRRLRRIGERPASRQNGEEGYERPAFQQRLYVVLQLHYVGD